MKNKKIYQLRKKIQMKKRGQLATFQLFFFIILTLIGIIILGVFMYTSGIINGALNKNILIGQVNLSNATGSTFGKFNSAVQTQSNTLGIITLFGMILGMIFSAFLYRDKNVMVFWILDFILLIGSFIMSLYISNQYISIIKKLPFSSYYISGLSSPTLFMTYLPYIITGVGVIMMIISYSGIPKSREEILAVAP